MEKERIDELARIIVEHSLNVQNGDRVLIRFKNQQTFPLLYALIDKIFEKGGIPFTKLVHPELEDKLFSNYNEADVKEVLKRREFDVLNHDCFISLGYNISFNKNQAPTGFRREYAQAVRDINRLYDAKRWVLINYPSPLDAKRLGLCYSTCFDTLINYICVDYKTMHNNMLPLQELLNKTHNVHIISKDTDLSFSIKNIGSHILSGQLNLPDGEIFSAPVKNSISGYIQYNVDSSFYGEIFKNIRLEFYKGKVVRATCENGKDEILNTILDQDEGCRYVGEFAFGTNPNITKPITDTLYDEKILGSIHLALGNCYKEAYNGNSSCIHWDMIKQLDKQHGGGKVYLDNNLVLKDGIFVYPGLERLNKNGERDYERS